MPYFALGLFMAMSVMMRLLVPTIFASVMLLDCWSDCCNRPPTREGSRSHRRLCRRQSPHRLRCEKPSSTNIPLIAFHAKAVCIVDEQLSASLCFSHAARLTTRLLCQVLSGSTEVALPPAPTPITVPSPVQLTTFDLSNFHWVCSLAM